MNDAPLGFEPWATQGGGGGGGGGRGGGGGGEGGNFSAVENSWKDTGATDWKEQMEAVEQPSFTNTAVVQDRRK